MTRARNGSRMHARRAIRPRRGSGRPPRTGSTIVVDSDVSEIKPDGNSVTLEDQLLKLGKIQADFATMTNLYRKQQGLLKAALGRGG